MSTETQAPSIPGVAGITTDEARQLLSQYGYNELPEKRVSILSKLLSYLWGPIPWMIEAAAILSAMVKHWADFIIILVLLVGNVVVEFWEEYQAGNAIEALKAQLALQARVKRDGQWEEIAARELVPGDLIRLRLGDIVPADARLVEGDEVQVDQSALTGESLPVSRSTGQEIYSGSILRQGEIDAQVTATGASTYFGKTAQLVESARTKSHFQEAVLKIGNYLIFIAIALVAVILGLALYRGDRMTTTLEFALVLTVAAIPVAMPTVLSVTMAVGSQLLARKKAIVSRLPVIEEMAGVDVLCSDKTGTLTKNQLKAGVPFRADRASEEDILMAGALASREEDGDAIDMAVLEGLENHDRLSGYLVLHFQPFDPVHKRTESEVRGPDGRVFRVTKGAPQVIMALSKNRDEIRAQVDSAINEFASKGYRSLGVARSDDGYTWTFLGIIPLYDPPRDDSAETIETARHLGVDIKMITGDQRAIAVETASRLGIGSNTLEASVFDDAGSSEDGTIDDQIEKADIVAQVFPEHKFRIVEALQRRKHIVGMTGDGVNDAPALKQADAGIAVAGATDAARSAADIVLTGSGISVIIDAIQQSRRIFHRMNSYAIYRIAETIRVLLFMTLSIVVFNFYPVTAVMIVFLALLNDGPILSIAYDSAPSSAKPEAWNMKRVLGVSTVLGLAGVVATFGLFLVAERVFHVSRPVIQTLVFLKLAVAGHLTIFVTRTKGHLWSSAPAPILFWSTVVTKVLATLAAVYGVFMTPISWQWAVLIWGYALAWFVFNDYVKVAAYRILDPNGAAASQ